MEASFKPLWAPKWSIEGNKIIRGRKTIFLSEIIKLSTLTESKGKGWNGVIQIWLSDYKFHTLAFHYNESQQAAAVYEYINEYLHKSKGKRIFAPMDKETKMKAFYNECVVNGVTDLNSTGRKEKAKLLLKKHFDSIFIENIDSLENFFEESRNLVETDANQMEIFNIQALKFQENAEMEKLTKYVELYGREKRIQMLRDLYEELSKKAADAKKAEQTLIAIGIGQQKKEIDWTVHGGIASAIGGTAAGISVAMDIQEKNAKIREENRNIINLVAQSAAGISSSVYDLERQAATVKEELKCAETKLVEELPEDNAFEYIEVVDETVNISKTGAFTISATFFISSDSDNIRVHDEFDGVIDGTIAADLYQKNEKVGTALLSFPIYGLENGCKVKGICTTCDASEDIPFQIKYRVHKFWKIEK